MIPSRADRPILDVLRFAVLATLAVWCMPSIAVAQDRGAARRHFDAAERQYAAGDWAGALGEYEAAHASAPMAEFLFNMAQCHRQLGHASEALALYQRFLAEKPDASNRATVEELIAEMRTQAAAAQPAPAPTPPPPPDDVDAAPAPAPAPPPATASSGPSGLRLTTWVALGGTVVLLGVSGLFALDASDAESDLASPDLDCKARLSRCLDLQDRGDRSAVLRNTFFLLGVAALAGTGVLAVLDLSRDGSDDRVALVLPAASSHGFGLSGVFTW